MPINRTKWFLLIAGTILGVLCCVFGCVSIVKNLGTKNPTETLPIRTLSIKMDENQHEELFTQLRQFSEKHRLKFNLSLYEKQKQFFLVMDGKGLEITVAPRPITRTEIRFNFYEKDAANPPSTEIVDELFSDLKDLLMEIPNVTVTEEK